MFLAGREIILSKLGEKSYDVSGLASGIYLIKVTTKDQSQVVIRMIKR